MVVEGMSFLGQPHANIAYHNILVQHEFGQYLDTVCSILSIGIETSLQKLEECFPDHYRQSSCHEVTMKNRRLKIGRIVIIYF